MTESLPEENEYPQIVNLTHCDVENVQAEMVRASRANVQHVKADEVETQTSITGQVATGEFISQDSIIGAVTSQQARIENSMALGVRAESMGFDGVAGVVLANNISAREINSIVVASPSVQANSIQTGLLLSREVHGNVITTLDARTAVMAASIGGAVVGLILLAGKLLFRPRK